MERALEAYVSREILNIFREYSLVAVNESLPGRIRADFHLRSRDDTDVFVEVSARKIGRSQLSRILHMYTAISNIEPPLRKFELVVIGPAVTPAVRRELEKLPIKLLTYEQIGITHDKLRDMQERSGNSGNKCSDYLPKKQDWLQDGNLKRKLQSALPTYKKFWVAPSITPIFCSTTSSVSAG